jgi:hypothetical protein
MAHWHIAHGLQGYGPDGADGFGCADSLESAAESARDELARDVDFCEESAHGFAEQGDFESAWVEHRRADSLELLRANLNPARSSAPLYADDPAAWQSTLRSLLEQSFPVAISHSTSLYVWECFEDDCEHCEDDVPTAATTRRMTRFADNRSVQPDMEGIDVYCDASLDEGAVIMATFESSPISSGREFFVGVDLLEVTLLLELIEASPVFVEDLESLKIRLERTAAHMEQG